MKLKQIRIGKWLCAAICVLLVLALLLTAALLTVNAIVKKSGGARILDSVETADWKGDCILVLGAGVWAGNRPSPMLADRLDCAISLYFSGAAPKLLMSGDHGQENYDEVNVMKDYAIAAGVPSEDIFMDHAGFSTYESLYRASAVFQSERPLVVTQRYHLYRALYIAQQLGLDARGIGSDPRAYMGQSYREAREILARTKDALQCLLMPEPTFLGEVIPISGNGDATNDRVISVQASEA